MMKEKSKEFAILKGTVMIIYQDFDTGEPVIKDRSVAFLLETEDKKEKLIVVYDKNALELGLIKVGEPLTCFGWKDGTIIGKNSRCVTVKRKRFLCMGIMGDTSITEDQLIEKLEKEGAIRLI